MSHAALLPEAFMNRILVDCPSCGGCAVVRTEEEAGPADIAHAPRRMTCLSCGAHRVQPRAKFARPEMGLKLRLAAECRHGLLWAYNEEHLAYLEAYVASADRRERVEPGGPRNRSILSRLPAWAKGAGNRDEVLKLIARMRARLG
jgi:predicted RNA-binding Zn-ribbon protein involved in translation (DUF1610 family)